MTSGIVVEAHLVALQPSQLAHLNERWQAVFADIELTNERLDELRPCWFVNLYEYEALIQKRATLRVMLRWLDVQIKYLVSLQ